MSDFILVSVIIPVYNKQEYITRCVESIIKPANIEYEVILVDDGSTDGSRVICYELSEKYKCVRVYCQSNQGVSVARNTGICYARGEYIAFVDADDFVTNQYWKEIEDALKKKADWYLFGYTRCSQNRRSKGYLPIYQGVYNEVNELCRAVAGLEICVLSVWAALYKREIIQKNQLEFKIGMESCEDFLFNLKYIRKISSYFVSAGRSYCYFLNTQSVTMKRPLSHADDYEIVYEDAFNYLNEFNEQEENWLLFQERWVRWIISLVYSWKEQHFRKKEIWENLNDKEYYKMAVSDKRMSMKTQIESMMLNSKMDLAIWLYMKILQIMKVIFHHSDL